MERHVLKILLKEAEQRMFEGAWRIARQKELIVEASSRGIDVGPYRTMLATFEDTLHLHIEQVHRIKRELYVPHLQASTFDRGGVRSLMIARIVPGETDDAPEDYGKEPGRRRLPERPASTGSEDDAGVHSPAHEESGCKSLVSSS
jgi:hypothetical protein